MAHHQLDELDEKILKLIIGNARMPFLEVARECNLWVHRYYYGLDEKDEIVTGHAASLGTVVSGD